MFEEFERIIKASYQKQPEALKKQNLKLPPQPNKIATQTFKPLDAQVIKPDDKDPTKAEIHDKGDTHTQDVSEIKAHEHVPNNHDLVPDPNASKVAMLHDQHASPIIAQRLPSDQNNPVEDLNIGVMGITGNYPLLENIVEIAEIDGAESANSPIAMEDSRSDMDSDIEIEEMNFKQNRLEKERLAQEEAMRKAAELKKKHEEEIEAKKKRLNQMKGDANDILSKYK